MLSCCTHLSPCLLHLKISAVSRCVVLNHADFQYSQCWTVQGSIQSFKFETNKVRRNTGTIWAKGCSKQNTRQAMYVQRKTQACSQNHCCREKAISFTYFCVCVCVCVREGGWVHERSVCLRTCRLTLPVCHASSPAPLHFSILSHKRHDFQKNGTEYKMFVLVFSANLFETFLILRKILRDIVTNVKTSSCTVSVIFVRF